MVKRALAVLVAVLSGMSAAQSAAETKPADLLIVNAHVVTMDDTMRVIEGGTVAIEGKRIVAVGGPEVAELFDATETLDADGDIVMPGMINTHTHASMTIFRGLGDDVPDRLRRYRKLQTEDRRNTESIAERRSRDKGFGKLIKSVLSEKQKYKGGK